MYLNYTLSLMEAGACSIIMIKFKVYIIPECISCENTCKAHFHHELTTMNRRGIVNNFYTTTSALIDVECQSIVLHC